MDEATPKRLVCVECGHTWQSDDDDDCPECGGIGELAEDTDTDAPEDELPLETCLSCGRLLVESGGELCTSCGASIEPD